MPSMRIDSQLVPFLEEMLYEFQDSRLEVCLVPSNDPETAADGGKTRACTGQNPLWYQRMCKEFPPVNWKQYRPGRKKQRTIVKRRDTINNIRCLIKNLRSSSKYAPYIVDEAQHRLEVEQEADGITPWDNQF